MKLSFKTWAIALISIWLVCFAILPNLLVIIASFLSQGETQFLVLPFSVQSYIKLLDPIFAAVIWDSLRLALITTVVCLGIGYPFAYITAKLKPVWRTLVLFLLILPFWTNSLIRTYAMKIVLGKKGVLNNFLVSSGLVERPIDFMYTDFAVIIGLVYILLPFMVLPLYSALEKMDWRLVEAARDLGANKYQQLWRVILPITSPGIISGCLLVFLPAMGMFYVADILGGAKSLLIGNLIKTQYLELRDWPFGSAASVTLTVLMGLMILLYLHASKRIHRKELLDD